MEFCCYWSQTFGTPVNIPKTFETNINKLRYGDNHPKKKFSPTAPHVSDVSLSIVVVSPFHRPHTMLIIIIVGVLVMISMSRKSTNELVDFQSMAQTVRVIVSLESKKQTIFGFNNSVYLQSIAFQPQRDCGVAWPLCRTNPRTPLHPDSPFAERL